MPELPEVHALALFLDTRMRGRQVRALTVLSVNALRTWDPPPDALEGCTVTGVHRHGKWLDVQTGHGPHLVVHLGRAGWVRWHDAVPTAPPRPGRHAPALRLVLDDGSGLDLTEAGTRRRLAVHVVRDPDEIDAVATLGPDPLGPDLTVDRLTDLLASRNQQLKGRLRDQRQIAGVGNAYSDEILHEARMSPFTLASTLDGESVRRLHAALRRVLQDAVDEASGRPAAQLKDAKRRSMRVHGRTGSPCPVCDDTIREVSFADSSLQYCPTCQTGGRHLADRRMSRLLK